MNKTDWNNELSSWSDEDFICIFHERPDLANRLRRVLSEPVKRPLPPLHNMSIAELRELAMRDCSQYSDDDLAIAWELFDRLVEGGRITDVTEPVKVPNDEVDLEEVRRYLDDWGCLDHPGVRALLARYGRATDEATKAASED